MIFFYPVSMVDYSNSKIKMHIAVADKLLTGLDMIRLQF